MRVRELIAALQKMDPELAVVYPVASAAEPLAHVVQQCITTTASNWMTDGKMVRVVYLNPPMSAIDRCER